MKEELHREVSPDHDPLFGDLDHLLEGGRAIDLDKIGADLQQILHDRVNIAADMKAKEDLLAHFFLEVIY